MLSRVARAWRTLPSEGRLAAGAALLLFLTMFLPWYQLNAVVSDARGGRLLGDNVSAFGVFSFVEAAVLLVAMAVLALLFARAEGRSFHLPGGDGAIVTLAGAWVALLLVWRLFDKPDVDGSGVGSYGIQWGIFFALGAAGLLALAGTRMRAAHRPEPPLRMDDSDERPRRPRRTPPPGTERTRPLPPEEPVAQPPARRRARPLSDGESAPDRAARSVQSAGGEPAPDRSVRRAQPAGGEPATRPQRPFPPAPVPADPPTHRLPERRARPAEAPTERLHEDPPTERLPEPPTERLADGRSRERGRPAPQDERLWEDG